MPAKRNAHQVRPEVVARLRKRIQKFSDKDIIYHLLLAARALSQKKNIRPLKMAKRNVRGIYFARKYKIALQIAMRRLGIVNEKFYKEMNEHFFDLARTTEKGVSQKYGDAIIKQILETIKRHDIDRELFNGELKKAMEELNSE